MATSEPIVRDTAITVPDFFRLLPRALDGESYTTTANSVAVGDASHGVAITIRPLEPRRIARLRIDRCEVVLTFTGYTDEQREAFFIRFDRAYQRGGG
ncbi:MAG: hypothetical protein P8Q36_09340 [Alphaproteobacteria bacterium]|jgi:hypothetical protein|nr:hypothetical protein [Rhodospirillaceae bacterium]MBT6206355.1 hypothetical protein [Rhodospirillaceae bacterium]MBT6510206.1 hypothetical protein [Rhodospirillaceae bacterium]MBT7647873.1 hypothetical protein [Rhodospirillaceae bacterium]MDG2481054.1 hypothetical protein [Alphaproteobacteria bacterium]